MSCEDRITILAKILKRSCHDTVAVMVRAYQDRHFSNETLLGMPRWFKKSAHENLLARSMKRKLESKIEIESHSNVYNHWN